MGLVNQIDIWVYSTVPEKYFRTPKGLTLNVNDRHGDVKQSSH